MTPHEYERFAAHFLSTIGHTNIKVTGKPSDHGVDVISKMPDGEWAITQVKFFSDPVGEKVIRDLAGARVMHKVAKAILVTNSYLTRPAAVAALQLGIDCYQDIQPSNSNQGSKQKQKATIIDAENIAKEYCRQRGIKVKKVLEVEPVYNAINQYSVVIAGSFKSHWFSRAQEMQLDVTVDMLSQTVIGYQFKEH